MPIYDIKADEHGAPDQIWLQLHGDDEPDGTPIDLLGENITWSWDSIYKFDVCYVRADIFQQVAMALDALLYTLEYPGQPHAASQAQAQANAQAAKIKARPLIKTRQTNPTPQDSTP